MYPLLYYFTNYCNFKLKRFRFRINFLKTNIFQSKEVHEQYRTDLLSGGSRMLFIATSGVDLFSYLQMMELEKIMEIDELLPPKLNASQGNSEDLEGVNGRKKKDEGEKADSTVAGDGYK